MTGLDGGIGGMEGMGVELGIGVTMGRRPPAFDNDNPRNRRVPPLPVSNITGERHLVGPGGTT